MSRSFTYENAGANQLIVDAQARSQVHADERAEVAISQQEASWRQRALNAEDQIRTLRQDEAGRAPARRRPARPASGIDGRGNSTLINRLLGELARPDDLAFSHRHCVDYVDTLAAPEDFASWVQQSDDVATQLLVGMLHRLDKLRVDIVHEVVRPDAMVLIDRGPKAVICSARAYLRTSSQPGHPPPTPTPSGSWRPRR